MSAPPDSGQGYLQDARGEDMLHLLENIPFSDPSALEPSYQHFGQRVYNQLRLCDVEAQECSTGKCITAPDASVLAPERCITAPKGPVLAPPKLPEEYSTTGSCATVQGKYILGSATGQYEQLTPSESCTVPDSMLSIAQDPEGVLEHKPADTAFVDSSNDVNETSVSWTAPKVELLPQEDPLIDCLWSDFKEDIPLDSPAQHLPMKHNIPQAFDMDFSSVLYSSCENYQQWIRSAADVMQNNRQLVGKYHIVATMQSADFPTPLSQAECVSLVMAYELLRTSQSEGRNVAFLDWICLLKDSEGRDSICKFAGLTVLGGVCLFTHSVPNDGLESMADRMFALLQQAISADDLAIAQIVLNWLQDVVNCKDEKGWTPLHLAAERNTHRMIHILCDKAAEREVTTGLGNTPLLVAAIGGAEEAVRALLAEKANPNVANDARWTPVHYAAVADNAQMIQLLHECGGELHTTSLKENSPLSLAVMNDSEEAAALLMQKSTTLGNWRNSHNWTALHLAASKNAPKMLQLLSRSAKVDLNAVTDKGHTPLALAVLQACLQAVEVLLEVKANPDICNSVGWSTLHMVAEQDACYMIRLLCVAGANTEIQTKLGNTPLCIAAMHGSNDAAAELLKQNANPNARNEFGWSAIHYSAAANASEMVRQIGRVNGADLDLKTNAGNTALLLAASQGAKGAIKVLVEAGADVNVKGPAEWSALHFAVNQDDLELIGILCDGGADVNAMCKEHKTPLMLAVMKVWGKAVRVLLDKCADPNLRDLHGWSALHMAAESNDTVEILQLLIDNGACVDDMTQNGNTALALAVLNNSFWSAEALLLSKADPSICGDHRWSPLHVAAERNYEKMAELLCSFGANLNATNQQGYTPLVISVAKDAQKAVGTLLKNGANPDMQSELNGWSSLHFAAQEDNHVMGELLCKFNSDLNVRTHEGNTPLLIAAMRQSKRMMSTLLRKGANANACDSHGWTALHCAAQEDDSEIIQLLCANSADCEANTDKGNTPLAITTIHNSTAAAQELLKLNADVNARNCNGWTPLCFAVYNGAFDSELIEFLCSPTNVSMQTEQHKTPLHFCVLKQNTVYTKCLLKCGADPSIPDIVGNSPLKIALCGGSVDIAEAMLEYTMKQDCISHRGGDVTFHYGHKENSVEHSAAQGELTEMVNLHQDKYSESINCNAVDAYGNTSLHIAARDGHEEVVKQLLEQDAELANVPGKNGYLPIQLAVMENQPAVIELLSHYCVAQDVTDQNGYTLIHLAAKCNCAEAAKQLLCDGHRPDVKDNCGYCPIHVAALHGSHAVIEVFLQHDMGMLSLRGHNGYTVLHCAAQGGQVEVVEFICSNYPRAININAVANIGDTPLHVAVTSTASTAGMIKALCKFGAEVMLPNFSIDTPLHCAVLIDDEEKTKALLSANPKLADVAGASGETPLHWAVKNSSSKMIDILCDVKCDVSAGDESGTTPLHFAVGMQDEPIVQQLLANAAAPEKENRGGDTPLDVAAIVADQNCFMAIHNEAQKAYHIDKVNYNMRQVHKYIKCHQMDKAGRLMSKSISKVQYWKYLEDRSELATDKVTLVGIMQEGDEAASCKSPCKVLLDKCIYGKNIIRQPALFEADTEGNLPGTISYRMQDGSFLSNLVKRPKLLFALADHPALQAYVSYRWGQIARPFFWRGVILYWLQFLLFTFVLASVARPDLPLGGGYRDPIDIFRGICEAAILLITVYQFAKEVSEIVNNCKAYPLGYLNFLQWCHMLLVLLIVPLRATAHPGQWIVAALAYITFVLLAFNFFLDSSYFGVYIQTLIIIFWRDIFKFLGVFGVVLMGYSGSLYLSLRYDADQANLTTAAFLSGEGSLLPNVYFWALRLVIDGDSTLDYSNTRNMLGPMTVIIHLLFVFVVVIILLNVLIAQVSETYTAVQSHARTSLLYNRSRFITRCEESIALWFLLWTCRWRRIHFFHHTQYDAESQCCRCLRHKIIREEFYGHDDDAMYWPGQLFHKNKDGEYLDLSLSAKFWRSMESVRVFAEKCFYPRIVAAYDETETCSAESCALEGKKDAEDSVAQHSSNSVHAPVAMEKELRRVQSLLASHEEAYEMQCAAMNKLQLKMNEIAEIQHAAIKQFHQHMEEVAEIRTATMKQLQLQKELSAKTDH